MSIYYDQTLLNDLNSAHFILILFLDIPTVHRTDELYTVVLGNNITMNCNYSSDPPVTHVQWKYNNSDSLLNIPIGKERYTGSIPPNPSLTIINTTFQDSGIYLCMVTNYLGSDVSDSIILQIIGGKGLR